MVTRERLLASVRRHMALQVSRNSESEVELVTLVWLFSAMVRHHVFFQMASCNAHYASVRLFTIVGSFGPLQMA